MASTRPTPREKGVARIQIPSANSCRKPVRPTPQKATCSLSMSSSPAHITVERHSFSATGGRPVKLMQLPRRGHNSDAEEQEHHYQTPPPPNDVPRPPSPVLAHPAPL